MEVKEIKLSDRDIKDVLVSRITRLCYGLDAKALISLEGDIIRIVYAKEIANNSVGDKGEYRYDFSQLFKD